MTFPKALLIDLDGTLVDTREANFRAYAAALAEVDIELERSAWQAVGEGRNWRQFLPQFLALRPDIDPAQIAARKRALYLAMLPASRPNPGLVRRLRSARARGARAALVTTASRENAHAVLAHHRLSELFDVIVTGCDVMQHKPAPDAFGLAAVKLGVQPNDCLVFEDSSIGKTAAAAFGARCIGVSMRAAEHA